MQKTLFITVFHSFVSKNILNTDALTLLRDSNEYRIVLLVPAQKKTFFETHYGHANIVVEGIQKNQFLEGLIEASMHTIARLLIDTHYLHYKRRELLAHNKRRIQHLLRELVVLLFSNNRVMARLFRAVDQLIAPSNVFSELFEKYQPHVVFSTDLFEQLSNQLVREAKKRKIVTVGMVRSWDNCLSKGLLRVLPDKAIVNNEIIRDELHVLHGVHLSKVAVVGLPQFDSFVNIPPADRDTFLRTHNLDPHKRIVMFAPGGNVLSDTDPDICDILLRAQANGRIPEDVQFFVRNHPQHPAALSAFENIKGMTIQSPGTVLDKTTHKETELTPEDQTFLRNILAHTDVLIWVATSLCLDALVYDIPQIVVNFDGYQKKEYYESVKRYHDEDHMKKMFALHPFRVANTPEDLVEYVHMYLNDKTIDASARAQVTVQQLHRLDGKSGKRVAEFLIDCASGKGDDA